MRILIAFLVFFQPFFAQQKDHIYQSKILDSVSVAGVKDETFAVYFPEKNNIDVASAVVFVFDPVARGKVGISPFILSAELYNYILISSNNSKNGSLQENKDIALRLVDHVIAHYKIDTKQMYVAGFSGGSRLAGSLALTTGVFQGVVGCGASFQPLDRFIPPANNFVYVGMVGENDMNYQEMIKNKSWLNKSNVRNELFFSDDGHVWPESKQILRAFDWLEMQAYKKGIRRANDTLLNALFSKSIKIADSLFDKGNFMSAALEYERIKTNFSSKYINADLDVKLSNIKKTKEYKKQLKEMEEISVLEDEISTKLSEKFDQELKKSNSKIDSKFWKAQKESFENIQKDTRNVLKQKMGNRLNYKMRAMVYEAGEEFKRLNEISKYEICLQISYLLKN
jgi:hypothetical protein